eukprot:jgi/Undpi1/8267/HiC_scaffold_25.g10736.m2
MNRQIGRAWRPVRNVISRGESSMTGTGERVAGRRVLREAATEAVTASRVLPAVIKPTADADLPAPLITTSRGLFGKRVTYDNPWAPGATDKTVGDLYKVMTCKEGFGESPTEELAKEALPAAEVELEEIAGHCKDDPMRVTWIGHATILVQIDGLNVLTDPMFSDRASANQMVGPKRFTPPAMSVADLPPIDVVLLSHNHYDHLDSGSVKAVGDSPLWIVPSGLKGVLGKMGAKHCVELSWWEEVEVEGFLGAVRFASTPAQHWSTRLVWDRNTSLWCGFAVAGSRERFYFAGDTAYCPVFGKIGERYGPFDLAALPIGAHEPAWFMKDQHCSPDEAVKIHQDLGAKRSFAVHWGTFPLAADRYADAPRELVEACRARGIKSSEFTLIRHGESIVNDGSGRRYKCLFGGDDVNPDFSATEKIAQL